MPVPGRLGIKSSILIIMIQDSNIRHARVGNYLLFYEVVEEKSSVNILRFRYSAMDISNIDDYGGHVILFHVTILKHPAEQFCGVPFVFTFVTLFQKD